MKRLQKAASIRSIFIKRGSIYGGTLNTAPPIYLSCLQCVPALAGMSANAFSFALNAYCNARICVDCELSPSSVWTQIKRLWLKSPLFPQNIYTYIIMMYFIFQLHIYFRQCIDNNINIVKWVNLWFSLYKKHIIHWMTLAAIPNLGFNNLLSSQICCTDSREHYPDSIADKSLLTRINERLVTTSGIYLKHFTKLLFCPDLNENKWNLWK